MKHAGHRAYKKVDQRSRPCDLLVQLHEIKIILGAVGAFVVKLKHAHILLLNLHGAIVEWVCGMLASGNCDDHIWGQHCSVSLLKIRNFILF